MSQGLEIGEKAVGMRLRLTTVNGEEFEGCLFAYDSKLNCLVIFEKSKTDPQKENVRIVRTSAISAVTALSGPTEESKSALWNNLPPVNWKKQQEREAEKIKRLKEDYLRTPEGLAIFAALLKQYPCKWDNEDIVIMESIRLSSPYKPENLSQGSGELNEEAVVRVRKLLEREHKKLSEKKPSAKKDES